MKLLLSEGQVGTMSVRNRIVMAAMHLGYAEDGFVTDRLIRYYEECAKGETGLIVVGGNPQARRRRIRLPQHRGR